MKKLFITSALVLIASLTFGQTLEKGNLIGIHVMTVQLDPDVTMNQFKAFFVDKMIPEAEKHFTGMRIFLLKGVRGENNNSMGLLYFFESVKDRDKFFNEDGSQNELGAAAWEKLAPINEELSKLGTWSTTFTDWIIQ